MRNGLILLLGLFAVVAVSWTGIVLGSNAQLGALPPYYDDSSSASLPYWFPGAANQGERVYRDLGCAACHTQQVRRPDYGSDQARGWGDRQSVARDYIYQPFPQLGMARIGPDLANLAGRKPSAPDSDDLLNLLYTGQGGMPPYRFLFETRRVTAEVSDRALNLTGALRPGRGWEIVPTRCAQELVAYLLSLNTTTYDFPEAQPVPAAGPKESAAAKAPATAPKPTAAAAAAKPEGGK